MVTFRVVNRGLLTWVLTTSGMGSVRELIGDVGLEYLAIVGACTVTGLASAVGAQSGSVSTILAVLPLVVLRLLLLTGRLRAHRDRQRLTGLFGATLRLAEPVAERDVREALLREAGSLLRCHHVRIEAEPNAARGAMATQLPTRRTVGWSSTGGTWVTRSTARTGRCWTRWVRWVSRRSPRRGRTSSRGSTGSGCPRSPAA